MSDPLKSYDWYSSLVPQDYAVQKPLSMLHDQGMDTPPVKLFKPRPSRSRGSETQAFVDMRQANPTVNLNQDTAAFKGAHNNNPAALQSLAGQLAHESHHITQGPAEGPAYDEQMRALQLFGASPEQIANIQRSKAHTLSTRPN